MKQWLWRFFISLLVATGSICHAADFKAGLAAVPITPKIPIRMSGYGGRTQPAQGVVHDLWAKALALEDQQGRFILITLDLVTIPGNFAAAVTERITADYRVPRDRVMLNCSHTHAGPVVHSGAVSEVEDADAPAAQEYTEWMKAQVVKVAGAALADLAPARLSFAHGSAGFGANRREPTPAGVKIGFNPNGPVDHDVPVIAISAPGGRLRGVIFGYACHNTTLTAKFLEISGDYAGFAMLELQKRHTNMVAMFVQLCGADQNPNPRGTLEIAGRHGRELADAVDRALSGARRVLHPPLRVAFLMTELTFPPYPRERFAALVDDPRPWRARQARKMVAAIDAGHPVRSIPYPVQIVRFGKDLTWIALGGEVVVDYALRAKREFGAEQTIVAGYSNEVMCYIASLRVLKEGGYEADDSLVDDGMPGPFDESVEERIFTAIRAALRKAGRQ